MIMHQKKTNKIFVVKSSAVVYLMTARSLQVIKPEYSKNNHLFGRINNLGQDKASIR